MLLALSFATSTSGIDILLPFIIILATKPLLSLYGGHNNTVNSSPLSFSPTGSKATAVVDEKPLRLPSILVNCLLFKISKLIGLVIAKLFDTNNTL